MAQSHLTKEELRHDVVQDTLLETVDYLQRHLKWVLIAAAVAVVVVAGGIAYLAYLQQVAQQESAAYHAAEKLLSQPNVPVEERIKQTESALQAFLKANPNSRLAPAAYAYLARFAFERKDFAKAEEAFQSALAHSKIDPLQRTIVLMSLGKLREAQGKPAEALPFFNQISDKHFDDAKAYALGTAELAEGKADAARKQFQQALTGPPGTSISTWAKDALDYLP
jgi:predicted negative regulator of RcsB-dependent stress response